VANRSGPVLSLGEVLFDFIATDGATTLEAASAFVARPGGAPANVAVALARLGVASAFGGVVGQDAFGRRLRATLADEGVDVTRLRATNEAETTLAFAWTDAAERGQFWLPRRAAADRFLSRQDVEAAGIGETAALCLGSVALSAEPSRGAVTLAAAAAAHHQVPVCFDVNLRPALWPNLAAARDACRPIFERATLVKLSLDDARSLLGLSAAETADPAAVLEHFWHAVPTTDVRAMVLTDGGRGCWYTSQVEADGGVGHGPIHHRPAFPVRAVESTGAGDAFFAALISRLLARDWAAPEEADIRFAAAAGALATTRHGAIAALPTAAEVEEFLRSSQEPVASSQ